MREAMAVTGYVAADYVDRIKQSDQIEIWPERDVSEVVMRVKGKDVEDVRVGSTQSGHTLVQLILREGSSIETAVQARVDPQGMKAFHDPVLNRIRQEATAKKIML